MYGMTHILAQIEVLATLLLQCGHDPLDELWEPEVLLLILFLGGLVAVVTWLVVRIFPKVRRDEQLGVPGLGGGDSQGALRPRRDHRRRVPKVH